MPHEKIINYYLLCSVSTGKSTHLMASFNKAELDSLMTSVEQKAYLRTIHGKLVAKENIVGGDTDITQFIK